MLEKSKKKNKKQVTAKTPASIQRGEQKKAKAQREEKPATAKVKVDKKYYEAVGRRKRAVARVRLFSSSPSQSVGEGNFLINNKPYKEYFKTLALQKIIEGPFLKLKSLNRFGGSVKIKGGGPTGQAGAIRHGISRALVLFDFNFRKRLKKAGFLTRDPREVERKKFGLKGARRRPQWSKR